MRGLGGECLCHVYLVTMYKHFIKNAAIQGLYKNIAWEFLDIHIGEADIYHQELLRSAINDLLAFHPEMAAEIIDGYFESKQAWDAFWCESFNSVG